MFSFVFLIFFHVAVGQEPRVPVFQLHTSDGPVGPAPLEGVREDWSVSLGGMNPREVKGNDVVSLRRVEVRLPAAPRKEHVRCANGDQIPGRILGLKGERLRFAAELDDKAKSVQELTLPLTVLSELWLSPAKDADMREERRRQDTVLLRNGDRLDGTLAAIDEKTIAISGGDRQEVRLERDRVAGIFLSTELSRAVRTKGAYGRMVLANGCRLSLASARADRQALSAKTVFGTSLQVSVDQVVALDLHHSRAVYLSDLKPSRYEHTPYFGLTWPYAKDKSVAGNSLRIQGSTYDKGLGMHSESRLSYDLKGGYRWFETLAGLDDQTGKKGSVVIQVLVDGKARLAEDEELTAGNSPRVVRVNVTGADELTLVVRFGRFGDVQDHLNWADARLIK